LRNTGLNNAVKFARSSFRQCLGNLECIYFVKL